MVGTTRSNYYGYMLLLCTLTLMLALAWPSAAAAQPGGPNQHPDANPESPGGPPNNPMPGGETPTTPGGPGTPPTTPPGPGGPGTTPDNGGPGTTPGNGMNGDKDDDMMMMGPPADELANRVVKHVATPVQLVIAGDGFHFFFIGADGSTVSGPVLPGFAELAEMHPSGGWVSLLDAVNPLTGKQVYVDYIPKDMAIRVFTYYPDKGMDVDKQYIFNFGADLDVNVEAW